MYRQVDRRSEAEGLSPDPSQPAKQNGFLEIVGAQSMLGQPWHAASVLPRQTTPLFDRDAEVERLRGLLRDPHCRLITITGPGGVGKTRLVLETLLQSAVEFPDGVIFTSLAPVRNPALVIPAIARSAGLQVTDPANALDNLRTTLHEQRILLVLDNFEQVVDAAPDIAQLLAACPHLKMLITSRVSLRISAEHLIAAAPLSLESNVGDSSADGRLLPGAVRLFVDRARRVDPAFELTDQTAGTILEICRRLDGLPLAIELAAARVAVISPAVLLERLDPRLPILTQGDRDLPERQQTMRSAIAWSYELLGERDRWLFRVLSVFVGGFRLPAAEAVVHSVQLFAEANTVVLDGVSSLLASNLLHRVSGPSHDYRYAMLEVVREYGLELLAAHGELAAVQSAHAGWYASIREWLDPNRFGPGERLIDHLWEIDAEHPNLRAALATCEATGDYMRMLDIAGATAVFWHHRGFLGEGRVWLERALEMAPGASAESRCWALAGLGLVCWTQSDCASAEPVLLESLALAVELEHQELQALSLHILALVDLDQGEPMRARDRIEQALVLWRAVELPSDEAMALHILSWLPARPGEPDTRMDDAFRCLAIFESIGHTSGIAFAHHRIGRLTHISGDERRAFGHFALAVSTWLSIDERWAINRSFVLLTELAANHHQCDIAASLVGAIDARMRLSDTGLPSEFQAMLDRMGLSLAQAMGSDRLRSAREAGRRMSPDEINALVAVLETRLFEPAILTQREADVFQHMAAGDTDREIADALFVSPRTVHSHVSHILAKLDVGTRREAVRRGKELGLLDSDITLRQERRSIERSFPPANQ